MESRQDQMDTDALFRELRTAVNALSKSAELAAERMALRAKIAVVDVKSVIAETAARELCLTATHSIKSGDQKQLGSEFFAAEKATKSDNLAGDSQVDGDAEELCTACSWLVSTQAPQIAPKSAPDPRDSLIAKRILELYDRGCEK